MTRSPRAQAESRTPVVALGCLGLVLLLLLGAWPAAANPKVWKYEWPKTDFTKASVGFGEIRDVIRKDAIRSIENPDFAPAGAVRDLADDEPVISVKIGDDLRAYPLRILMYHEIVNDTVGGVPVAVTFCPLCNSAVVFDRRVDGRLLEFGTTGKLRNSDMVMYDRQTESWWQQFLGEGIVGAMTGKLLKMIPVRVESFARFRARDPRARVMVPKSVFARRYGRNPYVGYDSQKRPYDKFFDGPLPKNIPALERVVVIGKQAWAFSLLRKKRRIVTGDLIITWEPGQTSALDKSRIDASRDVGNVIVQRRTDKGLVDAVHDVSFAFAFHAFFPDGVIHTE